MLASTAGKRYNPDLKPPSDNETNGSGEKNEISVSFCIQGELGPTSIIASRKKQRLILISVCLTIHVMISKIKACGFASTNQETYT
jgi:hypothetical protein